MAAPDVVLRAWRRWRVLACLAGSLLAGLVLLEVALRSVIFAGLAGNTRLGSVLRRPELYSSQHSGREYWKLHALFSGPQAARSPRLFDARFGWYGDFDPYTLAHADEQRAAGRTPVLLFGDSFAQCVERAEWCWQELLERSELSSRYFLLNYGVGGYGLDQAYLLLESVVERFDERRPVVVISILVDDDLDRCYLGLRGQPKPYFSLEGGELLRHPVRDRNAASYVDGNPVGIRSYLWRWFLFGSGLVSHARALSWTPEHDHVSTKQALNRDILAAIERELGARGITYFFLLFHAEGSLRSNGPWGWQEPFLYRAFEELGIPFVSSKRFLRQHMRESGAGPESFYYDADPGRNHYTGAANEIVFAALRAGLEGRFEPYQYLAEQ